jgi:hypothetical protein
MYGALDVAEQIRLSGSVDGVKPRTGTPYLGIRAFKFNIPLVGSAFYVSGEDMAHSSWFYDLGYWDKFLRSMAYSRYNVLTLWNAHPYDRIVRISKFPEANGILKDELDRNIAFFHKLLGMARDRGIDTYIVSWNIHMPESFKKAHNLADGQDSPLGRDYQRECVRALLTEYPELTGIGTCAGEVMPGSGKDKEEWIRDTYLRGIAESGRTVPFIHRYWCADTAATSKMLSEAHYPAPVLLDIKYNGEHMYSSTKPHMAATDWLTQKVRPYRLLWHLRSDLIPLRWCDPEFARDVVIGCGGPDSAGFVMGSELDSPGVDRFHTAEAAAHRTWEYESERQWMRLAVWGRMGYDPKEADSLWIARFGSHFGARAGKEAFLALQSASKILPLVTSFHWNYMDGDWFPEGNIGGWNTGYEQPWPNYREPGMFHNVREWIFNRTIDSSFQDIASFAADRASGRKSADGTLSPPEVARRLDAYADAAEKHVRAAESRVTTGRGEWECTQMDLQTIAALGRYYADKVRGATELATFLVTGDESHRSAAVKHLESAAGHWKLVSDITSAHYISHEILTMGQFDWKRYLPEAEKDVQAAREMKPFYRDEQSWKWSCGQTTRAPGRFQAPDWKPEQIQWLERWLVELSLRMAPTSLPADLVKELAAEKSPSATTTLTAQRAGQAVWWLRTADVASVHVNGKTVQPVKVSKDVGKFDLATQAGNNEVRIEFERAPAKSPEIYLETRD